MPDKAGIWTVQTCPIVKWSGIWMVVWKPNKKCLFYGKNVRFLNGMTNHVTRLFENQTEKVSEKSNVQY